MSKFLHDEADHPYDRAMTIPQHFVRKHRAKKKKPVLIQEIKDDERTLQLAVNV